MSDTLSPDLVLKRPASRRLLPLEFTYALRELRGGLTGFIVFIACISLGVAAIAAVGSVTRALVAGIEQEGQSILGGDMAFTLRHRAASPDERAFLDSLGTVSQSASIRAMARTLDRSDQTLAEMRFVDDTYPLYGDVQLQSGLALDDVLSQPANAEALSAVAEETFTLRLGLAVGDTFRIGQAVFVLRDIITREPDRLSGGLLFGPRVMASVDAVEATGLIKPGSLVRFRYAIAMDDPSATKITEARARSSTEQPDAGWSIRSREAAAPGTTEQITQFRDFLTLVGLIALTVGGVGVANSVRAYLAKRTASIATLKAVGARSGFILRLYLCQVLLVGGIAVGIGLIIGALLPILIGDTLDRFFPVAGVAGGVYPSALALAGVYGLLTAIAFALLPLARAQALPVSPLYREHVDTRLVSIGWRWPLITLGVFALLICIAVIFAENRTLAAGILLGIAVGFIALRLVGWAIMALARRVPQRFVERRSLSFRLALGNIHRPNALTPTVILSLGLGLSLLVTLALIETSLSRYLTAALPEKAPSFYILDIPAADSNAFAGLVSDAQPETIIQRVPMLRGRITSLKGIAAEDYEADPEAEWVLRGDRGITFADDLPKGARVVSGTWWEPGHTGSNLISFDVELAQQLDLGVGDKLVVNVLGRNIEVEIANLRTVDWGNLEINFVMIFSPNALAGAPHMTLATITYPDGGQVAREVALTRTVLDSFPDVTVVRVKEALEQVNQLIGRMAAAMRGAASVTLVTAVLVLAGALAATHAFRLYDAVILKTLGATRRRLLTAFALEFTLLGSVTAAFAVAVGSLSAWIVVTQVMRIDFTFSWPIAVFSAVGALVLTVSLGLIGSWRILGQKPAHHLRNR